MSNKHSVTRDDLDIPKLLDDLEALLPFLKQPEIIGLVPLVKRLNNAVKALASHEQLSEAPAAAWFEVRDPVRQIKTALHLPIDATSPAPLIGGETAGGKRYTYWLAPPPSLGEHRTRLEAFGKQLREHAEAVDGSQPEVGSSQVGHTSQAQEQNGQETRGEPAKAKAKTATVNQRMAEMIQEDPDRIAWSARQWAEALGCGKTAVVNSPTWKKTILTGRILQKADKEMK